MVEEEEERGGEEEERGGAYYGIFSNVSNLQVHCIHLDLVIVTHLGNIQLQYHLLLIKAFTDLRQLIYKLIIDLLRLSICEEK